MTLSDHLRALPSPWKARVRRLLRSAVTPVASAPVRSALARGLDVAVRARRVKEWALDDEPPHFADHQGELFTLAFASDPAAVADPLVLTRAFLAAELVRDTDVVLDIGCGSGFFTKRFLAKRAAHVDAIDIEPSAIATAQRINADPRVRYTRADAAQDAFPAARYDVVVWDGALGHFTAADSALVIQKIAAVLAPHGVFCGSETLGPEGHDHLQVLNTEGDLRALFEPHFPIVAVRSLKMRLASGYPRHEAYWRCARDRDRLDALDWNR